MACKGCLHSQTTQALILLCSFAYWMAWGVAMVALWVCYSNAILSCQYKVEAVIVSNEPSPKYWDRCVMTVRYQSPLPEDTHTFLYTMELPGYYGAACATTQDDPQQQGRPGIGKVLRGCVRAREPQHFLSEEEGTIPHEGTSSIVQVASLNTTHNLFAAAMVMTIPGTLILAGTCVLFYFVLPPSEEAEEERKASELNNLPTRVPGVDSCRGRGERAFLGSNGAHYAHNDQVHDTAEGKNREGDPLLGDVALKNADQC